MKEYKIDLVDGKHILTVDGKKYVGSKVGSNAKCYDCPMYHDCVVGSGDADDDDIRRDCVHSIGYAPVWVPLVEAEDDRKYAVEVRSCDVDTDKVVKFWGTLTMEQVKKEVFAMLKKYPAATFKVTTTVTNPVTTTYIARNDMTPVFEKEEKI